MAQEAGFNRVADDVGPRAETELAQQPSTIRLDGLDAQLQLFGDRLIGVALRQPLQHGPFALAQIVAGRLAAAAWSH